MIKIVSVLILNVLLPLAHGQEKPKDEKELSPSEVVKQWNDACAKRDMKTIGKLASKTTTKRTLELVIGQGGFLQYEGQTKIIHEEISGARAVVIYRIENNDAVFTAAIRYGVSLLVREDGLWKVKEQEGASVHLKVRKAVE